MPRRQDPDGFPGLSMAIGNRVKQLRTRHGVSLSALAAATRLGKGTLSELERGRRNPTLDTLFAIATTLSVPLSELLVTDGDTTGGQRAQGQSVQAELIGRWTDPGQVVEVYRMTISAGRRDSKAHTQGVLETVTVISGEVRVGATGDPAHLGTGQSHTFAGDQPHHYEGIADHSSTVLVMRYPT